MGNPTPSPPIPPEPPAPAPTLDYAAARPHSHARKWLKRVALAILILASLYAAPLAWLYVGWKQEQPARQVVARVRGEDLLH